MILPSQLKAGDVILCSGNKSFSKLIRWRTKSRYSHASICYDSESVVEASKSGVRMVATKTLIRGYPYVAVLRNPDVWTTERIAAMQFFLDKILETGAKYNYGCIRQFLFDQEDDSYDIDERIRQYFLEELKPKELLAGRYFCSELVMACFIVTGIISEAASFAFQPKTFAPVDIAKEDVCGWLLGYISMQDRPNIYPGDDFEGDPFTFEEKVAYSKQ